MGRINSTPISVVIVEDEPELADIYEQYLQDEFDTETTNTGAGALDKIDASTDVVLLDRRLPDLSGDEVLTRLRERGFEAPVAMVTAVDPDIDLVDMPFDEYIVKPVDRDLLVRTVQMLANRASFEKKSREFFRLASKKASLDADTSDTYEDTKRYNDLIDHMTDLQTGLNDTVNSLIKERSDVVSHSDQNPAEIKKILQEVSEHQLPDNISELVEKYQNLNHSRPRFMWKWVHRLAPQNTLPCVDQKFVETVPVDKTITILFITLLDDILEKQQDRMTFNELLKIPSETETPDPSADGVNTEYVTFAQNVWNTLLSRMNRAPKYGIYEDLLRYDIKQAVNSIEYSNLAIRRPDLVTMEDLVRYESHNMVMFAYSDIDLMHSSIEARDELPVLREAIWTAQLMARIGNWVSTWERELREGDYSAGPVVYALDNGIISRSDLIQSDNDELADELIEEIKGNGVEKEFLTRWERHYHELLRYDQQLSKIDLEPFIDGTQEVLRYHLASTGLK